YLIRAKHVGLPKHCRRRFDACSIILLQRFHMCEDLAQLLRERRLFNVRQRQPSQVCHLLNFLLRNFHSSFSCSFFNDVCSIWPSNKAAGRMATENSAGSLFQHPTYSTVTLLARFLG